MSKLSSVDKGRILALLEEGYSQVQIAAIIGVNRKSVALWKKRWEEEGHVERKPKSGRPRCTTRAVDDSIVSVSVDNPFFTSIQIKDAIGLTISKQTVIRRLSERNLRAHRAAVKEELSCAHRTARLAFAQTYANHGIEYWKSVVFTDETTFSTCSNGSVLVYRPPRSRFQGTLHLLQTKIW